MSEAAKSVGPLVQERLWHDVESDFTSLSPLQQAVVRVMAGKDGQFSPFGENAMSAYKALVPDHVSVSAGTVQNAIDAFVSARSYGRRREARTRSKVKRG